MDYQELKDMQAAVKFMRGRFDFSRADGGPGSGNWGHAGRPGEIGGSASKESGKSGGIANRYKTPDGGYTSFSKERRKVATPHQTNATELKAMPKGTKLLVDGKVYTKAEGTKWTDSEGNEIGSYTLNRSACWDKKVKLAVPKSAEAEFMKDKGVKGAKTEKPKTTKKGAKAPAETPKSLSKFDDVTAERNKRVDEYAKSIMDPAQYEKFQKNCQKIKDSLTEAFEKHDFVTDCDTDDLISILNSRLMNQMEVGHSHGYFGPGTRATASEHLFGHDGKADGMEKEDYEKYGHLGNYSTHYGECQIVLKKENMWDRTTATMGDSLGESYDPVKVSDPSIISFSNRLTFSSASGMVSKSEEMARYAREAARVGGEKHPSWSPYIELQYHGLVTPSDFAKVIVPSYTLPSQKKQIEDRCKELGIEVVYK